MEAQATIASILGWWFSFLNTHVTVGVIPYTYIHPCTTSKLTILNVFSGVVGRADPDGGAPRANTAYHGESVPSGHAG